MAVSLTIAPEELKRQAAAVFEGKTYKVFLVNNTGGLTVASDTAAWEALELTGNGYAAVTGNVGVGAYNTTSARYELPAITATFTAAGGSLTYNTVCVVVDGATFLHSIAVENPTIALADGQSKTYTLTLAQDD